MGRHRGQRRCRFDALLARDLAGLPSVRTLAIVSASGRVEADSTRAATGRSPTGPALAEFEVAPGAAPVAISRVWRGRDPADGVPVQEGIDAARSAFFFTCSRRSQASADAPYAVATINPDFFATFLSGIVGRPEYVVELYRYDGTLLLSTRPQAARPARAIPASGLQHPAAGQGDRVLGDNRKGPADPPTAPHGAIRWSSRSGYRTMKRSPAGASRSATWPSPRGWRWSSWRWWRSCCIATTCEGQGTGARTPRQRTGRAGLRRILRRHLHCRRRAAHRAGQSGVLEITGYTESEAIGRTLARLSNCGDDDAAESEIWGAVRLQGEWRGDRVCRRNDGSLYWQRLAIGTVFDRSGAVSNPSAASSTSRVEGA